MTAKLPVPGFDQLNAKPFNLNAMQYTSCLETENNLEVLGTFPDGEQGGGDIHVKYKH